MTGKNTAKILSTLAFIFLSIFIAQSSKAEWGVSVYGEVSTPGYYSYGDRITTEYRRGYQVDDWVERGSSSVTDSPLFSDGIRLASWATRYENDHDFGLASGIYFFEIPDRARSIRVKIYYEGEADRGDFNGGITGRVWIRKAYAGEDYIEYYPDEARYEDVDQPLYGDTFILRANKHLEILRMSADEHTIDGMMELHVVAEGRQRIDVKYIEVETYSYMPSVRVVTKYYKDYTWRPWYDYTYWYFYTGPTYHFADHYYVRYTYPRYRHNYVTIRKRYNTYLRGYYTRYPRRRVRWVNVARVNRGVRRTWDRDRLNKWTREHDETRRSYIVTSAKKRRSADVKKTRTRIRSVITSHSRVSPAETRARSGIKVRSAPSVQRRSSVERRSSANTNVKTRRSTSGVRSQQYRSPTRTQSSTRTTRTTPSRVETQNRTRSSNNSRKTNVRTRSSSSTRQAPARSTTRSVKSQKEDENKKKRSTTRTRTQTRSNQSSTRRAPSSSSSTKKDDDDDDDEKKKRSTRTRSSSSTRSSSTTRKTRTRTR